MNTHASRTQRAAAAWSRCCRTKRTKLELRARVFVVYIRDPTFPLLCAALALLIWSFVLLFSFNPFAFQSGLSLSLSHTHTKSFFCPPVAPRIRTDCIWNSSRTLGGSEDSKKTKWGSKRDVLLGDEHFDYWAERNSFHRIFNKFE